MLEQKAVFPRIREIQLSLMNHIFRYFLLALMERIQQRIYFIRKDFWKNGFGKEILCPGIK